MLKWDMSPQPPCSRVQSLMISTSMKPNQNRLLTNLEGSKYVWLFVMKTKEQHLANVFPSPPLQPTNQPTNQILEALL